MYRIIIKKKAKKFIDKLPKGEKIRLVKAIEQLPNGEDGKKTKLYYHKVLEAKIVLSENVVLSPGSEFIENEKANTSKQDCEMNAARRLLKKIKQDYPRLPVCIQGDALYAAEPSRILVWRSTVPTAPQTSESCSLQ